MILLFYLTIITTVLPLLCQAASQTTCGDFISNKKCPWTVANIVEGLENVTDPVLCQSECSKSAECKFFTWVRSTDFDYPAICLLFRGCDHLQDCDEECFHSVTGPAEPSYTEVCCGEFQLGCGCHIDSSNLITSESYYNQSRNDCQRWCQDVDNCNYFQYEEGGTNSKCSLLTSCHDRVEKYPIWTGPKYPSIDTCPPMAALLLGGGGPRTKAEIWPGDCSLEVPDIPEDMFYTAATVLGSSVFLCGGDTGTTKPTSACFVGNVSKGMRWIPGPEMIVKRRQHTLNTVGDTIVAVGGAGSTGNSLLPASVEMYKEGQDGWRLATWELTSGRVAHCAATLSGSEFIVAGGLNSDDDLLSLVEIYNIRTGSVVALPPLPDARADAACIVQGKHFIVSGGRIANGATESFFHLNLKNLQWSSMTSLKTPRRLHFMGILNGVPAVFGGQDNEGRPLNTMEILSDTSGSWELMDLQNPRSQHAMVLLSCP